MSSPPVHPTPGASAAAWALSPADYLSLASNTLAQIEATVDAWLDNDTIDIDANRTGGMLELALPNDSRLIINTQPPLQELWLAARSGGYHFRWVDGAWRDTRDGREFFDVLSECAAAEAGRALRFSAGTSQPQRL